MIRSFIAVLGVAAISTCAIGQPVVAGSRHAATPAERGHTLIGEFGCVRCHDGMPPSGVDPRLAPDLSRVGERVRGDWIARFIADPQGTKPGTTMPHATSPQNAEAIAHWLVSRSRKQPRSEVPDLGAAARGERLFHQVGCVACHAPRREDAEPLEEAAVPLPPDLHLKYGLESLERFLRDPLRSRPSGRMPHLGLRGREARDLSHYLLRGTPVNGPLHYAFYPKRHETLDTFDPDEAEPERTGVAQSFDPAVAGRRGHDFALRFTGFLRVPRAGRYIFQVASDDGTRLYIDGALVVDNDGHRRRQQTVTRKGTADLAAGLIPIELRYFQRVKHRVIEVQWSGPDLALRAIEAKDLQMRREPVTELPSFTVDRAKAERGKALFTSEGCTSCHRAESPIQPPDPVTITAVSHERGCLAPIPEAPAPDFKLTPEQKTAIRAALEDDDEAASDATVLARRLRAFDCYACHERDGIGGPSEARSDWFTSDGHNQGQEGRIPPRITGVGDKLKLPWLRRVLDEGASVRPLFHTRMPRFGKDNLEGLADALAALDRKPSPVPAVTDSGAAQREAGRLLVGPEGGFNCISCHRFNQREAPVMQMVDLVGVTDRIHEDWFQRWIRDPGAYNPGTRMPEYLAHQTILDGDRDRQFAAIWSYLSDGKKAVLPKGVSRQNLELVVGGEAIVYRGKIREAGFRGICVGGPEEAHYAFDSEACRPALLWKGRFLNVAAHWRVQSMGRVGPLGHDVIKLPKGNVWWSLSGQDETVLQPRFRGYRLGALKRPTFLYDLEGRTCEEQGIERSLNEGRREYVRTLTFDGPGNGSTRHVHLLARGKAIEARGEAYAVDDRLIVMVKGGETSIRDIDGQKALYVTVETRARVVIEVRYQW